jgi:hypothetical protein
MLRVLELPDSNLGPETGYSDRGLSWFFSVPPGEFRDSAVKLCHYYFFKILSLVTVTFDAI